MREPIIIGLDDSPIVIQAKGVDWSFSPDPPAGFIIEMMRIAKTLENGELDEYDNMAGLLAGQLTDDAQRKRWVKAELGFAFTNAILMAYIETVGNLPTPPS